jgi:hypothetical protein
LKAGIQIKNFLGSVDTKPVSDLYDIVSAPGWDIFSTILGVIGDILVGLVMIIVECVVVSSELLDMAYELGGAIGGFLADAFKTASDWASSFTDIGNEIINGIVDAITGGAGRVVGAITDMASSAIAAAKKSLKIASPSKVFGDLGDQTVEGYAGAIDEGSDRVGAAVDALVGAPEPKEAAAPAASSSGGAPSVVIEKIEVNGVQGAADMIDKLEEILIEILERRGMQIGTAAASA